VVNFQYKYCYLVFILLFLLVFFLDGILVIDCCRKFLYICLLGTASVRVSYGRFIAIRYKFEFTTHIQEPLVRVRRGCVERDLNDKTVSST
jgi:hypothetical protein